MEIWQSIGIKDSDAMGTLDGFVILKNPDTKETTRCIPITTSASKGIEIKTEVRVPCDADTNVQIKDLQGRVIRKRQNLYTGEKMSQSFVPIAHRTESEGYKASEELQAGKEEIKGWKSKINECRDETNVVAGTIKAAPDPHAV